MSFHLSAHGQKQAHRCATYARWVMTGPKRVLHLMSAWANNDLLRSVEVIRATGAHFKRANFAVVTWSLGADWHSRLATPHSALAKDVMMVAGTASRISMSWIWSIASASATLDARLNEIVIVASSFTPEAVALWLSVA